MTNSVWRGQGVLILGATSAIAEATAREFAAAGARIALVARDSVRLEVIAADLRVRGAPTVTVRSWDLVEVEPTKALLDEVAAELGGLDGVLIAHGQLGDQTAAEADVAEAARLFDVNFTSAALWALVCASFLERTRGMAGVVAVIGSVAGDRGRNSNFIYGSAKAGIATLFQGLSHRHAIRGGPRAVVFKLGFVETPMTAGMKRGGPLWSSPETVAKVIFSGMSGQNAIVYGPWFWRYVALVVRLLPQAVIRRVDL